MKESDRKKREFDRKRNQRDQAKRDSKIRAIKRDIEENRKNK
jgi:hypothetical protein